MKAQKFYQTAFKFIFLLVIVIFLEIPTVSEAAETYSVGVVGITIREKDTNLGKFMHIEEFDTSPLKYVQANFRDKFVDNSDLKKKGLKGVPMTDYTKESLEYEEQFRAGQREMRMLDEGDTSEVIKLFDKKLDYLIYGYINSISVSHRESFGTSNSIVNVNLSVRIVDATTGKVVCVAVGRGSDSNHGGSYKQTFKLGEDKIEQDSLFKAFQKAMDQAIVGIIKQA